MVRIGGKTYLFIGAIVFLASLFIDWKRLMVFGVIGIIMFFVGLVKVGGGRKERVPKQALQRAAAFQPRQHRHQQEQYPTQQRFCTQCGSIIRHGDRFCAGCGRRLL